MRRRRRREDNPEELELNITPLIDVVFILLIFFMVTATFVRPTGVEVNRPQARTAVVQERGNILVAIDADNNVWIDRRQVDIRAVRANIERLHAENPRAAVVIQADATAHTATLVAVMDAAREAGVADVAIAAERP